MIWRVKFDRCKPVNRWVYVNPLANPLRCQLPAQCNRMTGNSSNRWKLFWRPTTGRNLILARASVRALRACVHRCIGRLRACSRCTTPMWRRDATRRIDSQPRGYYADVIWPANTLPGGPIPIRLTGNAILLPFAPALVFCVQIIFSSPSLPRRAPAASARTIDKQLISVVIKSHNVRTKRHFFPMLQPRRARWFPWTFICFIGNVDRHCATRIPCAGYRSSQIIYDYGFNQLPARDFG